MKIAANKAVVPGENPPDELHGKSRSPKGTIHSTMAVRRWFRSYLGVFNIAPFQLFILVVLLSGCVSGRIEKVSAAHTILPASQQDRISVRGQEWTPEEWQITLVEQEIGLLFAHPDQRMKGLFTRDHRVPFPLAEYSIVYCGVINDGKKLIVGYASHKKTSEPNPGLSVELSRRASVEIRTDRIRTNLADVASGGGPLYFIVTFDVEAKSLLELGYYAPL
jgi:hypothetical protein